MGMSRVRVMVMYGKHLDRSQQQDTPLPNVSQSSPILFACLVDFHLNFRFAAEPFVFSSCQPFRSGNGCISFTWHSLGRKAQFKPSSHSLSCWYLRRDFCLNQIDFQFLDSPETFDTILSNWHVLIID